MNKLVSIFRFLANLKKKQTGKRPGILGVGHKAAKASHNGQIAFCSSKMNIISLNFGPKMQYISYISQFAHASRQELQQNIILKWEL